MSTAPQYRLTADELRQHRQRNPDLIVVDVRTEDAVALQPVHIPGTHWTPLPGIISLSQSLPKDADIALYCT